MVLMLTLIVSLKNKHAQFMYFDINTKYYKTLAINKNIYDYISSPALIRNSVHPFYGNKYSSSKTYKDNIVNFWLHHNYAALANINYGQNAATDTIVNNIIKTIDISICNYIKKCIYDKTRINVNIESIKNNSDNLVNIIARIFLSINFNNIKKNIYDELSNSTYGFPPPIIYKIIDKEIIPKFEDALNPKKVNYGGEDAYKDSDNILSATIDKLKSRQKIVIYISSAHCYSAVKYDASGRSIEFLWSRLCGDLLQATLVKLGFTAIKVFPESILIAANTAFDGISDLKYRGMRAHIVNNYLIDKCKINNITPICISLHTNASGTGHIDGLSKGGTVLTSRYLDMCDILASCIIKKFKDYELGVVDGNSTYKINYSDVNGNNVYNELTGTEQGLEELSYLIRSSDYDVTYSFTGVLSESLHHDNANDIDDLWSKEGNKKIILAHIMGIYDFLTTKIIIARKNNKSEAKNNINIVENTKLPKDDTLENEASSIIDNLYITEYGDDFEKRCIYGGVKIGDKYPVMIDTTTAIYENEKNRKYEAVKCDEMNYTILNNGLINKTIKANKISDIRDEKNIIKEIISAYPYFERKYNGGKSMGSELVFYTKDTPTATKKNVAIAAAGGTKLSSTQPKYEYSTKINNLLMTNEQAQNNIFISTCYMKNKLYNVVIF